MQSRPDTENVTDKFKTNAGYVLHLHLEIEEHTRIQPDISDCVKDTKLIQNIEMEYKIC